MVRPWACALGGARRPRLLLGPGEAGTDAEHTEHGVEDVVLAVDRDEAEDGLAATDDEAPDRDNDVDGAEREGVGARRTWAGSEGKQAQDTAEQVNQVVPRVHIEHPDDRVHGAWAAERGAVEDPDNPCNRQRPSDQDGVEAGWGEGFIHFLCHPHTRDRARSHKSKRQRVWLYWPLPKPKAVAGATSNTSASPSECWKAPSRTSKCHSLPYFDS